MIAIVCALLTAVGFYFSIGLGEQWWLAWLAPIPVLWFAFGETKGWQGFLAAWAAYALGATSILRAYAGVLPLVVVVVSLTVPSFFFALAVMGGRVAAKRIAPLAGMVAFACLWTAFDFLASFSKGGGSVATPATAEVFVPALIQSASVVGVWGITFLLGFVPAGLALSLRQRTMLPATVAVAVFAANAVFGFLRIAAPAQTMPVTLIDTDSMDQAALKKDTKATADTVAAYANAIRAVKGASLIVLPEKLAIADAAQQPALKATFADAARSANAVLVAGSTRATAQGLTTCRGRSRRSQQYPPSTPSGGSCPGWSPDTRSDTDRSHCRTARDWRSARTWISRR